MKPSESCSCEKKEPIRQLVERDELGRIFLVCSICETDTRQITEQDIAEIKFNPQYAVRVIG